MTGSIELTIEQRVAVLSLMEPDRAALGAGLRTAVMDLLDQAEEEDEADAIVLLCASQTAWGIPATDGAAGADEPSLRDLCERIEFCDKPVVVALGGVVHGAGLELALAARHRIAGRDLKLGAPEIRLGLPPMGGATQRLPRLLGAGRSLRVFLGGHMLAAEDPLLDGLFDAITDEPLKAASIAYAHAAAVKPHPVRDERAGFSDMQAYQQEIAAYRDRPLGPPASVIVDLVESAALLPFPAGLEMEQEAFETCRALPETAALRHLRAAELELLALVPKSGAVQETIAVIGANVLAVQLVAVILQAGHSVRWGGADLSRIEAARRSLGEIPGMTDAVLAGLSCGLSKEVVDGASLIILASRGGGPAKAPADALVVDAMPGPVSRLALRFPTPLRGGRVAEMIVQAANPSEDVQRLECFLKGIDRLCVPIQSSGGSIAGRFAACLNRASDALLDMGADPFAVDDALEGWGFAQGPFVRRDILGLAGFASAKRAEGAANWSAELVEIDRMGAQSGEGFYVWDSGQARPDRAVIGVLNGQRRPAELPPEDIAELILAALANEAVRMLASGMAGSAKHIDVVSVDALRLSRSTGGVLFAAQQVGLFALMKRLERVTHCDKSFWTPHPIWAELVKNGLGFDAIGHRP